MLYPDHIEHRFNNTPVATRGRLAGTARGRQGTEQAAGQGQPLPFPSREAIHLVVSVAGNMLLGSLLLGTLLMAPLWLHGLLLPLL